MVRCVQLYFKGRKQQREIAKILNMSASRVSRLLQRAEREGFYTVEFHFPALFATAAELIDRYHLRDAVVIPTGERSELKEDLGTAAARYFEKVVGAGARVGLSCGNTLFYLVKHLSEGMVENLHIYPLAAENSLVSVDIAPNTLVGMMTAKYRPTATGYALPAQPLNQIDEAEPGCQGVPDHPEARQIYEAAQNVDVALIGVGALDAEAPGFCALAAQHGIQPEQLEQHGAVGEFNYQPMDRSGRLLEAPEITRLSGRVITVSLKRLRELSRRHGKLVIGVGGGREKLEAIRAVLSGHVCNVLITDQQTARALLEQ